MFSKGSEYYSFMEENCFDCPFFIHFEDVESNNSAIKSVCNIEEKIALAGAGVENSFPYEWLDENGRMSRYDCRKRKGLDKKGGA